MNALLTDLYELTMAAGYFEAGKADEKATFEFAIRRLPAAPQFRAGRRPAAGGRLPAQPAASTPKKSTTCAASRNSQRVSPAFFDYLRDFRFTGDLFAVPEGTPLFAGEPLLTVRAPIVEAQIPETYVLSALSFPTLIATKAARMVEAAAGRPVVEFGTRRAHTPEAGVLGARAAYIGGCAGTSNTLAGFRYRHPGDGHGGALLGDVVLLGDASFPAAPAGAGRTATQLIDTYDTLEGARRAAQLGRPLWGVRLDSGDLLALSRQVRGILDEAGLPDAKIMASRRPGRVPHSRPGGRRRAHRRVRRGHAAGHFGRRPQPERHLQTGGAGYPRHPAFHRQVQRGQAFAAGRQADFPRCGARRDCALGRMRPRGGAAAAGDPGRAAGGAAAFARPGARARGAILAKLPPALRQLEVAEGWPVILSRELRELIERTRQNLGA